MEAEKNQELARLIGRRLREACSCATDCELPGRIARSLAALREMEARRLANLDGSGSDNVPHIGADAAGSDLLRQRDQELEAARTEQKNRQMRSMAISSGPLRRGSDKAAVSSVMVVNHESDGSIGVHGAIETIRAKTRW